MGKNIERIISKAVSDAERYPFLFKARGSHCATRVRPTSQRMYSPKVIRELKGSVFKLAERIDPKSEVITSGFDAVLDHMQPDQRITIQVAISNEGIGVPITREDIFQDVVLDDLHQDPRFVVRNYLSRFARTTPNIMPIFKYVRDLGDDVERRVAEYADGLTSTGSFRTTSIRSSMPATHKRFAGHTTVAGLAKECDPHQLFYFIPQLADDAIDVDEPEKALRDALLATEEDSEERRQLLAAVPIQF